MATKQAKTALEIAREMTERFTHLNDEDLQALAEILVRKEVKRGEIFIPDGIICRDHIYVEKGLVRQYYYKNGHDVTEHFSSEGDVVMSIESLYAGVTNHLLAEALEPCILWYINYKQFIDLVERSFGIARYYRVFQEDDLIITQHKADAFRFESSRERYERFVKEYPEAAKRAPLQHIASYLLMTPETLSRIRAGSI
ncbi:MAG: Crp/Fnr family transcriptional regulator [Bacteroidales bacterium]|nr:Crp/Fnr family transcriptional regulator [Bacteroidales bacterium]